MKRINALLRCFLGGALCALGCFGFMEKLLLRNKHSIITMTACILLGIIFNYLGCAAAVPDSDRGPDAIDFTFFALGVIFTGGLICFEWAYTVIEVFN
jgi:hypothetical protein